MENRIARGERYFVYLDPAFGHELGGYKTRPVVVVSINDIHRKTGVVRWFLAPRPRLISRTWSGWSRPPATAFVKLLTSNATRFVLLTRAA
jgi:hypothetical protein